MIRRALSLLLALCAAPLGAQTTELTELSTANQSRGWEAVGRLDVSGKGFCTGALIAEDTVLTAAHCVHDENGEVVEANRIRFLAGLRSGHPTAARGVSAIAVHPDYVHVAPEESQGRVEADLAVIRLDHPVRKSRVEPFEVSHRPRLGEDLSVVSYAHDRQDSPALQEVCQMLGFQRGVFVLTCEVDFGSSGSPVFAERADGPRIVAVVSAKAELEGEKVALATSFAILPRLLEQLDGVRPAQGGGGQRFISVGTNRDTSAIFVRPGE